jgi:hypothetical protein
MRWQCVIEANYYVQSAGLQMLLLCCQSESVWPEIHLHLPVLPKQLIFVLDHHAVLVST